MNPLHLALLLVLPAAEPVPGGAATRTVATGGVELKLHTYRPEGVEPKLIVLVFHGTLRNATEYRDWAKVIGDRAKAVVAAPEFDAKRFSGNDYHRGGLLDRDGGLRPKEKWTFSRVPELAELLRKDLGRPKLPYVCIGHSAGGQFLDRLAAFVDTGAARIVPANPGSLLFPTKEMKYGYGLGELPPALANDETLKRYLAAPLTLYLGTADTATTREQDEYLDTSAEATKQGASRFARGHNCFREAEKLAKERGWPFQWRLVEADGVGHEAEKMFAHARCLDALGVAGKE